MSTHPSEVVVDVQFGFERPASPATRAADPASETRPARLPGRRIGRRAGPAPRTTRRATLRRVRERSRRRTDRDGSVDALDARRLEDLDGEAEGDASLTGTRSRTPPWRRSCAASVIRRPDRDKRGPLPSPPVSRPPGRKRSRSRRDKRARQRAFTKIPEEQRPWFGESGHRGRPSKLDVAPSRDDAALDAPSETLQSPKRRGRKPGPGGRRRPPRTICPGASQRATSRFHAGSCARRRARFSSPTPARARTGRRARRRPARTTTTSPHLPPAHLFLLRFRRRGRQPPRVVRARAVRRLRRLRRGRGRRGRRRERVDEGAEGQAQTRGAHAVRDASPTRGSCWRPRWRVCSPASRCGR